MLARDGPEVLDEPLDGLGQVDDFGVPVDLDIGTVELVDSTTTLARGRRRMLAAFARCG